MRTLVPCASEGWRVTTLMVASIPLLPYSAEEAPRTTSILSTRSISSGKSLPTKVASVMFSPMLWPLIITMKRVSNPGKEKPRIPTDT